MTSPNDLTGLLAPLIALQRLLARFDDQGVVIGGVAASLLGKPRLTADVDAVMLVSTDDLPRLMEAAAQGNDSIGLACAVRKKLCQQIFGLSHPLSFHVSSVQPVATLRPIS